MFTIDKQYAYDNYDGNTLLHVAVDGNNASIVEILLKECNANPNIINNHNETTLFRNSKHGNLKIMKLLIKYKFNLKKLVNVAEHTNGFTVFHTLCIDRFMDCIKYLFNACQTLQTKSFYVVQLTRS